MSLKADRGFDQFQGEPEDGRGRNVRYLTCDQLQVIGRDCETNQTIVLSQQWRK